MPESASSSLLVIPSDTESSAAFKARLAELIAKPDTQVYVDTSFLMWLTKIGSGSRQELLVWLKRNIADRVHVPIWAAHEYLKHHVAGTIITELSARTDEVAKLVRQTYTYFRPFIDEPIGDGAEDPSTIRAATRNALNALDRMTSISRQWHRSYGKHAAEVIAFINETTPGSTPIYDYFPDLAALAAGRFIGSIPPGFQDRRKKGVAPVNAENDDESLAHSNRYGDLVFWKETLEHAKAAGAKAIIIITNDRKNDWHLGGGGSVDIEPHLRELKKNWKPVPCTHPMLRVEAKQVAGLEQVELLDSAYLAALLRDLAEDEVRDFADVAIIPDGPEPETEAERRSKLQEDRTAADSAKAQAEAEGLGYLFADQPEVSSTKGSLMRALFDSRQPLGKRGDALIDAWRATVEEQRPLGESITADTLEGYDHKELTKLSRELHDRVLAGEAGYSEAATDLISLMDRLPPNTAAALYLGLLASMYLVRENNVTRLPPASPAAQLLFSQQAAGFAGNAIAIIAKRLHDNEVAPLYIPDASLPRVAVTLDNEPDTAQLDQLSSLKVKGVELLTPAQANKELRLRSLFLSSDPVDGEAILRKAAELFALPLDQIERTEVFGDLYSLTDTIGFKRPVEIAIPKEPSGADQPD